MPQQVDSMLGQHDLTLNGVRESQKESAREVTRVESREGASGVSISSAGKKEFFMHLEYGPKSSIPNGGEKGKGQRTGNGKRSLGVWYCSWT